MKEKQQQKSKRKEREDQRSKEVKTKRKAKQKKRSETSFGQAKESQSEAEQSGAGWNIRSHSLGCGFAWQQDEDPGNSLVQFNGFQEQLLIFLVLQQACEPAKGQRVCVTVSFSTARSVETGFVWNRQSLVSKAGC